ncbi:hypothetical protein FJZ53_02615 [Candidatus Woesearchaeota archaeon]|nr:hypothetical protein [Candidatus Woesearchaeota archaeon]
MKVPLIFMPEKNLEKNVDMLLKEEQHENSLELINGIEIESKPYEYAMFYEESLNRVIGSKFDRHLYPWRL